MRSYSAEKRILECVASMRVPDDPDEEVAFRVDETLVLLDSALTGDEASRRSPQRLVLAPGDYRVLTKRTQMGEDVAFITHWFLPDLR